MWTHIHSFASRVSDKGASHISNEGRTHQHVWHYDQERRLRGRSYTPGRRGWALMRSSTPHEHRPQVEHIDIMSVPPVGYLHQRRLFPRAVITGWKYELSGSRAGVLARSWRQISENHTDACVVNGRAWGGGFALCTPPEGVRELRDKAEVARFLPGWLKTSLQSSQQ